LTEASLEFRGKNRFARILSELHYTLRTEGDSPGRKAAAIGLGTFIGCVPLYGTHLILCASLARLFHLNRLVTYLAAHINNPLTAPWLLFISFGIGHHVSHGRWPPLRPAELTQLGLWNVGRDLMIGSLLLGLVLGSVFAVAAFFISKRARRSPRWNRLIEETGHRYISSGIYNWEFVRSKMRHDPLYRDLFERLESWPAGDLLDLGCGRGIALTLVELIWRSREAPESRPGHSLKGVDRDPALVRIARRALGENVDIQTGDLADYEPPPASIVLMMDVLNCMQPDTQERLLRLVAKSLRPGGRILIREADARSGLRFRFTKAVNSICAIVRRTGQRKFYYRSREEWIRLLKGLGLSSSYRSMGRGSPFANVMIEAQKPVATSSASIDAPSDANPG